MHGLKEAASVALSPVEVSRRRTTMLAVREVSLSLKKPYIGGLCMGVALRLKSPSVETGQHVGIKDARN